MSKGAPSERRRKSGGARGACGFAPPSRPTARTSSRRRYQQQEPIADPSLCFVVSRLWSTREGVDTITGEEQERDTCKDERQPRPSSRRCQTVWRMDWCGVQAAAAARGSRCFLSVVTATTTPVHLDGWNGMDGWRRRGGGRLTNGRPPPPGGLWKSLGAASLRQTERQQSG